MNRIKKTALASLIYILFFNPCAHAQHDWENPAVQSKGTTSPHAFFRVYSDEKAALNGGQSDFIISLNGLWKFKLVNTPAERPVDFFKDDFDISEWKNIHVPANWQTEGFDRFIFTDVEYPIKPDPPHVPEDFNPVGSYKKNFDIPSNWHEKDIFIRFGAVNSFFYLWINDHYVGFNKDSKTPAEFNITPYLKKGKNSVSAQVFRFSDGTYLEGQDMWKLSGIERDVSLIARPKISVYDFFVKAGLNNSYTDGVFNLDIALNQPPSGNAQQSLRVKIMDDASGNTIFQQQQAISDSQYFHFHTLVKDVRKWNAETPNLYSLIISHLGKNGKQIESIVHKIGFRTAEIKHGLFLINGVPIKIKGVNRHEHDMITGKAITMQGMENDIRLMKQYNINAMRASHYPNGEEWYRLCDQYGIYVIDEANIECDGMSFHPLKTLSDQPGWKLAYMDRTKKMFERDKNNCSIVTWSLGNESGFGENFISTYNFLKSKDNTRPVQYEAATDHAYSDIYCPMYKNTGVLQDYMKEWRSRPLILCEYAHMMGNSGGNLEDDWRLIYKYQQLQGGFIWDFCDQAFKRKDKQGRDIWAYGRDMGMVGLTSDTSFCADGLFAADRSPHPQAYELKKVYQPVGFEPVNFLSGTVKITNRFDFINLNNYYLSWHIKGDGKIVASGETVIGYLPAQRSKNIDLSISPFDIVAGTEYFLTVEVKTKKGGVNFPVNSVVAWEQFPWPRLKNAKPFSLSGLPVLEKRQTGDSLTIFNRNFAVSFNIKKGWLQSYVYKQVSIIQKPLQPHFWRGATDNDIGNSQQIRCEIWQHALENAVVDSFRVITSDDNHTQVNIYHSLPAIKSKYQVQYTVMSNGDVKVNAKMICGNDELPELPRFGMKVILNKEFDKVTWFGRGPFDNYSDRQYAAAIDIYQLPADSLFHPYARAQESGYRTGVRWIALQNKNNIGLMAIGAPELCSGVLHFNMDKLNFDRDAAENNHGGSMANEDMIWWNIDYGQSGVGGDNAWGARPHAEYQLPYMNYEYSFILRPVASSDVLTIKSK